MTCGGRPCLIHHGIYPLGLAPYMTQGHHTVNIREGNEQVYNGQWSSGLQGLPEETLCSQRHIPHLGTHHTPGGGASLIWGDIMHMGRHHTSEDISHIWGDIMPLGTHHTPEGTSGIWKDIMNLEAHHVHGGRSHV